jgi:hypothetical protein
MICHDYFAPLRRENLSNHLAQPFRSAEARKSLQCFATDISIRRTIKNIEKPALEEFASGMQGKIAIETKQ